MRLLIEIAIAALLVFCITATSAAFAADKVGRSADGLSCAYSVPENAAPAARCVRDQAAMRRQILGERLQRLPAVVGLNRHRAQRNPSDASRDHDG
jgi:hypothetical protein